MSPSCCRVIDSSGASPAMLVRPPASHVANDSGRMVGNPETIQKRGSGKLMPLCAIPYRNHTIQGRTTAMHLPTSLVPFSHWNLQTCDGSRPATLSSQWTAASDESLLQSSASGQTRPRRAPGNCALYSCVCFSTRGSVLRCRLRISTSKRELHKGLIQGLSEGSDPHDSWEISR